MRYPVYYSEFMNLRRTGLPRVKLNELSKYEFQYNTTIKENDLNYANHLGNDSLVRIIQDTRIELFKSMGFSELDLGDGRTGIIIGDLVVNFKAEGFSGEELRIDSRIGEITEKSCRIFHRVMKSSDNSILALVETGLVAFDYDTREITQFPAEFIVALKNNSDK
jgi:4-hydroxybenzoyl-CoA thioesterase